MRRKFWLLAAVCLLVCLLAGCGSKEQTVTPDFVLTYADNQPADYPTTQGAERFAALVKERTGGKVVIQVKSGGEYGTEQEVWQQLSIGGIDFARLSLSVLAADLPKLNVLQLPCLYEDAAHMWRVLDGPIGEEFLRVFAERDMVGLSWYDAGARSFYSDKSLRSLEDLQGMTIRVQDANVVIDMVKLLGGDPVTLAYSDVYAAFETDKIDAAENNWPAYLAMEHYKVARYYLVDEHSRVPEIQLASGKTWAKLPDEYRSVLRECARESARYERELWTQQEAAARKSDFERGELNKDKTGVRLDGIEVVNPANGKVVPMFVSDYVLMGYGTGIVMGVPGHDQRDWDFATAFHIPIVEVVEGGDITKEAFTLKDDTGIMVNSGFLNGMTVKEAIPAMKQYAIEQGWGHEKVNYKLRDWVFSRQRYWGEPIPLVNCPTCGWVPVPEEELPLVLPQVESYEPTDDGESPISKMTDWVNTKCPKCGGPAKRETDTMPQWAGSSWYFLRYMDPHNDKALVSHEAENYWGPVDWYNGGMEHTTLHLLYSRFWHKFLYDIGVVHTKEPYAKRTSHGMILGQNPHYVGNVSTQEEKDALIAKYGNQALRPAVKMSKSLGNVVNPDDVVKAYGADTMRLYIMFIGDFEKVATWSDDAVKGCKRFLDRVWNLAEMTTADKAVSEKNEPIIHKTIKKVTDDIDTLKMNTAIAALMTMVNEFYANGLTRGDFEKLLLMLSPFAPHMVEELWEQLGCAAEYGKMAMQMPWPEYDESKTVAAHTEMAVQVNGKLKGTVTVAMDSEQDTVVEAARQVEKIAKALDGMQIVKAIFVKNKLINLIVGKAKIV